MVLCRDNSSLTRAAGALHGCLPTPRGLPSRRGPSQGYAVRRNRAKGKAGLPRGNSNPTGLLS